jgi:hypothetical protein
MRCNEVQAAMVQRIIVVTSRLIAHLRITRIDDINVVAEQRPFAVRAHLFGAYE